MDDVPYWTIQIGPSQKKGHQYEIIIQGEGKPPKQGKYVMMQERDLQNLMRGNPQDLTTIVQIELRKKLKELIPTTLTLGEQKFYLDAHLYVTVDATNATQLDLRYLSIDQIMKEQLLELPPDEDPEKEPK